MKRPQSIDEMEARTQAFVTDAGLKHGLSYVPDASDIFISPYAKCGTTWMQQIVHGLRTGGAMAFDEITEVVPWLELAHDMGVDVNAPQVAAPRAFKSHLAWDDIPRGGKYIIVFRDPMDAMVSLFRFLEGWHFETGSISPEDFAEYVLNREGGHNYWIHAASWWRQRGREDVLLLAYEEMKRDLPGTVARVAAFIGVTDSRAIEIATEQAAFDFMKARGPQFDDHLLRAARDAACGLPPGGTATKVDRGKVGRGMVGRGKVGRDAVLLSDDIRQRLADRWRDVMTTEFGLDDYPALVAALSRAG